jgi:hypothetical protein
VGALFPLHHSFAINLFIITAILWLFAPYIPLSLEAAALLATLTHPNHQPRSLSMYKLCRLAALTHLYRQPEALRPSKLMGLSSFAAYLQL